MSDNCFSPRTDGRQSAMAVSATASSFVANSSNITPQKSSKKKKTTTTKVVKGQKLVSGFTHYMKPDASPHASDTAKTRRVKAIGNLGAQQ